MEARGMPPREVDACEIWEIAKLLGVKDSEAAPGRPQGLSGFELLKARVEAHKKSLPPPVALGNGR
jgi:hypothetical protein